MESEHECGPLEKWPLMDSEHECGPLEKWPLMDSEHECGPLEKWPLMDSEHSTSFNKRKERKSSGSQTDSEFLSPEAKRVAMADENYDQINEDVAIKNSAERQETSMEIILKKLNKLDVIANDMKFVKESISKIDTAISKLEEDVKKLKTDVKEITNLKKSIKELKKDAKEDIKGMKTSMQEFEDKLNETMNAMGEMKGIQTSMKDFEEKLDDVKNTTREVEKGLNYLSTTVEGNDREMKDVKVMKEEIANLKTTYLKYETYDRRENLRFYGIPEEKEEDTKAVLYKFLETYAEIPDAKSYEIQRVHRTGKRKGMAPRAIIARFLRFPDRENIFAKRRSLPKEYGIGPDYPPEVVRIRKALLPKFKEAREMGKQAHFSRREPQKLFIDGQEFVQDADK
ncbi:hypothetical protein AC249_AIPGENE26775 [Exaiptasia diaphana]|nr:hypothetical protein AC249_AIPGENE26775 [Exaiptasia diaphana]